MFLKTIQAVPPLDNYTFYNYIVQFKINKEGETRNPSVPAKGQLQRMILISCKIRVAHRKEGGLPHCGSSMCMWQSKAAKQS